MPTWRGIWLQHRTRDCNQYNNKCIHCSSPQINHDIRWSLAFWLEFTLSWWKSVFLPSLNVYFNAGTDEFHTENDQCYTLFASPYQNAEVCASFPFAISKSRNIRIRLGSGMMILFNARLLTHRQSIDSCNACDQFWNIRYYANRRFDNHTYTLLQWHFHSVLSDLHIYIWFRCESLPHQIPICIIQGSNEQKSLFLGNNI